MHICIYFKACHAGHLGMRTVGCGWKLTVQRVPWSQRPHVSPHEVSAVFRNSFHARKDLAKDISALVTVIHPYVFRALQRHAILREIVSI